MQLMGTFKIAERNGCQISQPFGHGYYRSGALYVLLTSIRMQRTYMRTNVLYKLVGAHSATYML